MRRLALGLILLLIGNAAFAAPLHLPALTGRVVDNAHILSPQGIEGLEQKLANYESGTGNQVAVATIASLEGDSIEDYSNRLFRKWQLGQKDKNNGVLLLIAPKERKVRLEVGYGLEGVLTDAVSSAIIHGVILPAFKSGNMEGGVIQGSQAILDALGGKSVAAPAPAGNDHPMLGLIVTLLFIWLALRHPFLTYFLMSNSRFGSSSFSGSGWSGGGGGFSGGGGSSGGGGASGSW